MEPQRHKEPGHPSQPPYPPQQPYHGQQPQQHPQFGPPQYGPPQQWGPPPPKKKKSGWILGVIALSLTICGILLFAGCSALVNEVNGGGGSHAEKLVAMNAAMDKVPEEGWTETGRFQKPVEAGCLSIDTECLRLDVSWSLDHQITIEEIATRLGMDIEDFDDGGGYGGNCMTKLDGSGRTDICVGDSSEGGYGASVRMARK
jgi:hypothetical protein